MKLKMIMIGLLPLLACSHSTLAREVGSCPLPTEFVITSGSLKFGGIPQPKSFSTAYFIGGQMVCNYNNGIKLTATVTGNNCKMVSKNGSTAPACQAPKVATDCKITCD